MLSGLPAWRADTKTPSQSVSCGAPSAGDDERLSTADDDDDDGGTGGGGTGGGIEVDVDVACTRDGTLSRTVRPLACREHTRSERRSDAAASSCVAEALLDP